MANATTEDDLDGFEEKILPNATTITNVALKLFPNVKNFFEILVKDVDIKIKDVGRPFQYDYDIIKHRYYSSYGQFMDYFMRKHLSNQFNIAITDRRTEHILNNPDDYIINTKPDLRSAITRHYEIFKDPDTMAMDIVKSIKIVSLSHSIFFHEQLPKTEFHANEDNLREIIKYFRNLPYTEVDLNPTLGCDYFNADGDLIFDNDVIYEIKTSKFKSLSRDYETIPISKFYQPIIYGFGFYKKTGKIIKHFKIYNGLLSYEYSIELNDIDMELFEEVLKKDVDAYDARIRQLFALKKISDDQNVLDKKQ